MKREAVVGLAKWLFWAAVIAVVGLQGLVRQRGHEQVPPPNRWDSIAVLIERDSLARIVARGCPVVHDTLVIWQERGQAAVPERSAR